MSVLGNAIRSNADLHQAIYEIIGTLAAAHLGGERLNAGQLFMMGATAVKVLEHLPQPQAREG